MPVTSLGGAGDNDWLQSLLASFGAGQPNAPGATPGGGAGPQGLMPGGGVMGYQAATPGQPSMGYPAASQGQGQPPGSPMFQFGGVHPGNILQSHPPGSATLGPVFNASGSPGGPGAGPGGPGTAGNDGGFNNPYMAAAGANPAQGGPYVGSGPPGMPGPAPGGGGIGSDARFPVMGAAGFPTTYAAPGQQPASAAATMANAPPGQPSATPRPARPYTATPATARSAAKPSSSNPRFGLYQSQVPGQGGPLSRNPIYTTLNLFGART